ncbi:hypothetical protein C484_01940 [Natrialba taiwanensis DSM 12281]|uniref:Uncharacterized protein n=1 Tax=Natrialba taiwanensis DSM 12281 TaxID=1230458 RepID=M0ADG4_9EURY|nr:hypothetical protein C484_01940 [Natrialba taiwanensis DSM 12281]
MVVGSVSQSVSRDTLAASSTVHEDIDSTIFVSCCLNKGVDVVIHRTMGWYDEDVTDGGWRDVI